MGGGGSKAAGGKTAYLQCQRYGKQGLGGFTKSFGSGGEGASYNNTVSGVHFMIASQNNCLYYFM